jgi:hypothetical protein
MQGHREKRWSAHEGRPRLDLPRFVALALYALNGGAAVALGREVACALTQQRVPWACCARAWARHVRGVPKDLAGVRARARVARAALGPGGAHEYQRHDHAEGGGCLFTEARPSPAPR